MTSVFSSIAWPAAAARERRPSRTAAAAADGSHGTSSSTSSPSATRAISPRPSAAPSQPLYFDPDTCVPEPEEPDLRELNAGLQALADIFPDIQPEVFREMLGSFGEESRLQLITEALLRNGAKWIQGRYRIPEPPSVPKQQHRQRPGSETGDEDTKGLLVGREDRFRNARYKDAVKALLYQEFKGLSHSTIKAVLAEHNYSYTRARPTLLGLVTNSWRFSITSFFTRRKAPTAESHPLLIWRYAGTDRDGMALPDLKGTGNAELDRELYDAVVAPLLEKRRAELIAGDRAIADQLNEEEAEAAGEMYDCQCCFVPNTMEQMSACDDAGHYICFRCIQHAVSEALYGQGWLRNISVERGTLKCIAPTTDRDGDCAGCIPVEVLRRAILDSENGDTSWQKLHDRCATEVLQQTGLPLIQCPFCPYAELDDFKLSTRPSTLRFKNSMYIALSVLSLGLLFNLGFVGLLRLTFLLLSLALSLHCILPPSIRLSLLAPLNDSLYRTRLRRRGLRFQCASPTCQRASCLRCYAAWQDPHICSPSSSSSSSSGNSKDDARLTSLRNHLEAAITNAVKRTCPRCHLSFVKASGCNKLACVCGYTMCYVCRAAIGPAEGYAHFCQHFRPVPGAPCADCDRCELYQTEDEAVVLDRARREAEREWRALQKMTAMPASDEGSTDSTSLGAGKGKGKKAAAGPRRWGAEERAIARSFAAAAGAGAGEERGFWGWVERKGLARRETWEDWLDKLVDAVVAE